MGMKTRSLIGALALCLCAPSLADDMARSQKLITEGNIRLE